MATVFNKKILVVTLSTVLGLGAIGSVAGTLAWVQSSSRSTVSLIGFSTTEAGGIEISADGVNYQRDLISNDLILKDSRVGFDITPSTFGKMNNNGSLPAKAYKDPKAVNKEVHSDGSDAALRGKYPYAWDEATGEKDYIQYDVYLRGRTFNGPSGPEQLQEDVYITDYLLNDTVSGRLVDSLRIHMAIDEDGDDTYDSYLLFSKSTVNNLPLYGNLDCNNDDYIDIVGGYETALYRDDNILFGNSEETQTTNTFESKKATRDSSGAITGQAAKKILTTPLTGASKITVTVWLEGWHVTSGARQATKYTFDNGVIPDVHTDVSGKYMIRRDLYGDEIPHNYILLPDGSYADGVTRYYTRSSEQITVPDWNSYTAIGNFQFSLTFDVGVGQ